MANIFRKKDAYIDRVNRSTFDLSFVNNLTMKFGAITPVCLLPASFGDSFQINARFNLQLLPTVFPIQTQLYVRLHFVYVRTRTLWEDWMSFFGGDETVTPPWLDPTAEDTPQGHAQFNIADDLQTGTLADYLGIPTTITGTFGKEERFEPTFCSEPGLSGNVMSIVNNTSLDTQDKAYSYFTQQVGKPVTSVLSCTYSVPSSDVGKVIFGYRVGALPASSDGKKGVVYIRGLGPILSGLKAWEYPFVLCCDQTGALVKTIFCYISQDRSYVYFSLDRGGADSSIKIIYLSFPPISQSDYGRAVSLQTVPGSVSSRIVMSSTPIGFASFTSSEWTKPEAGNCPFYTPEVNSLPAIPLSALPFRAYEAYYNAFGRDIRNNPFIVDGSPEYNHYKPCLEYPRRVLFSKWTLHYRLIRVQTKCRFESLFFTESSGNK